MSSDVVQLMRKSAVAIHRELRRVEWFAQIRAVQAVERAAHVVQVSRGAVRFDIDRKPRSHRALLECLWDLEDAHRIRATLLQGTAPLEESGSPLLRRTGGMLVTNLDRLPHGLLARVEHDLGVLESTASRPEFEGATRLAKELAQPRFKRRPDAAGLWRWYERDAASVYALLEKAHLISDRRPTLRQRFERLAALRLGDVGMLLGRGLVLTASAAGRAIESAIAQRSSSGPNARWQAGNEQRPSRAPIAGRSGPRLHQQTSRRAVAPGSAGSGRLDRSGASNRPIPLVHPRPHIETGEAHHGFMPERLARLVEEQPLNIDSLRVTLRGYQAFGARYALLQRRTLLGDEMGLGKTIVALAVMAHLAAEEDASHFLVVAPNSVLFNWRHEVEGRLPIPARILHGASLVRESREWKSEGGVGITTYGTLQRVALLPDSLPLLVVDEAHFIKNPLAGRSINVAKLLPRVDRVMFMTGTPLENKVSEFRTLATTLNPQALQQIPDIDDYPSHEFRAAAAPVYLRRNQEDVLPELPETIENDEWVEFTEDDKARFIATLKDGGHFMSLRYCAFPNGIHDGKSAKLERLVEIVDDAMENYLKVVVFSEYHATLDAVLQRLSVPIFGPITGSVAGERRLSIIREFSDYDGGAVLVSQVQAGGIGLNIQAASVVVLCEPALKPSVEDQAIARAARMGQTRHVRVHRLLTEDGIDRRIVDLLVKKRQIFNDYARRSALAEVSEAAVERELVSDLKDYIQEESRRLGVAI